LTILQCVGKTHNPMFVEPLLTVVREAREEDRPGRPPDYELIHWAAGSLVEIGTPEAVGGLLHIWEECQQGDARKAFLLTQTLAGAKSPQVRDLCLAVVRGPAVWEYTEAGRKTSLTWPRYEAAQTLGELGGPGAQEALEHLLADAEAGTMEIAASARALAKLGDPAAIPALEAALKRVEVMEIKDTSAKNATVKAVREALEKLRRTSGK